MSGASRPCERRSAREPRHARERGSATVLVLALAALTVAVAAAAGLGGAVLHAGARARTAADLAALAAADALASGTEPCAPAEDVARRNAAALVRCTLDSDGVTVLVEVRLPFVAPPVRARARAEPGAMAASSAAVLTPAGVARAPPG